MNAPNKHPLRTNNPARWKWMTAAATTSAAATTASPGATVQIDLLCNLVNSIDGVSLNADLTGDGNSDVVFDSAYGYVNIGTFSTAATALVRMYGAAFAAIRCESTAYCVELEGTSFVFTIGSSPVTGSALIEVTFQDTAFNGGAVTNAFLEIRGFSTSASSHSVELVRLVFDDASTAAPPGVFPSGAEAVIGSTKNGVFTPVPEPSSLALLALGAGGLLTRRQRKTALH